VGSAVVASFRTKKHRKKDFSREKSTPAGFLPRSQLNECHEKDFYPPNLDELIAENALAKGRTHLRSILHLAVISHVREESSPRRKSQQLSRAPRSAKSQSWCL
jgi:hypothetical protein